jgi:uncharacterized repeat protein (TIGR01451 family)
MSHKRLGVFCIIFVSLISLSLKANLAYAWIRYGAIPGGGPLVFLLDPTNMPVGMPGLAQAAVEAAWTRAMATWTNDPDSTVTLQRDPRTVTVHAPPNICRNNGFPAKYITVPGGEVNVAGDGVNSIGWSPLPIVFEEPELGPVRLLAYAFVQIVLGAIVEVDICFNSNIPAAEWNQGPGPGVDPIIVGGVLVAGNFDIETVALHELGHGIGLGHPNRFSAIQRPAGAYQSVVMLGTYNVQKRVLRCDDRSGANYSYPPPIDIIGDGDGVCEPGEVCVRTELRPLSPNIYPHPPLPAPPPLLDPRHHPFPAPNPDDPVFVNAGGCDFGDAPDPDPLAVPPPDPTRYPSRERGRPGDPILPDGERLRTRGAAHKDPTMEWLGPIDLIVDNGTKNPPLPQPPKEAVTLPPLGIQVQLLNFKGSSSVTFEPESMQVNLDELDDGVSLRDQQQEVGVAIPIDILICTTGLPGRYVPANPANRLYLNGWEDWNGNGIWGRAAGPGAPGNEWVLHWEGTPPDQDRNVGVDVAFSPNFLGGRDVIVPAGILGAPCFGRLLTFTITPPAVAAGRTFFERFRLDYGENGGVNPQPYTEVEPRVTMIDMFLIDPILGSIPLPNSTPNPAGVAKYGEVEDYQKRVEEVHLAINMGDHPDPVKVGKNLTYTIRVANTGSAMATGVQVTDTLPKGVNFVSASPGCSIKGRTITCTIPSLAPDEKATLQITVQPTVPGGLRNTVSVTANEHPRREDVARTRVIPKGPAPQLESRSGVSLNSTK